MLKKIVKLVYKPARIASFNNGKYRPSLSLKRTYTSNWSHVEEGPQDPILGIQEKFVADTDPNKLSLVVGAYRTDEGKHLVLPSVKMAEETILNTKDYNHEYGPMSGLPLLCNAAKELAFGKSNDLDSISSIQSLSGTGCLRVLLEFINLHWKNKSSLPKIHLPNPTWGAHKTILQHCNLQFSEYPYFDNKTLGLDYNGMSEYINKLGQNDVLLLHSVAHNPTGVDPTKEQWQHFAKLIKSKGCFVLFDSAYQGFASGDCERDAYAIRLFREHDIPLMLAQSFAKNMGLYGERCGVASIQCKDAAEAKTVSSQFKLVARGMYSNPPVFGGKIAQEILTNPEINAQWLKDIKMMADRINNMRTSFVDELRIIGSKKSWKHVTDQIGMFSFTGLTAEQCDKLMADEHLYLTRNGRISVAGLNTGNIKRVAQCIYNVTKND